MKLLENKKEMRKNFDESFRISTYIKLSYYETNMYINPITVSLTLHILIFSPRFEKTHTSPLFTLTMT